MSDFIFNDGSIASKVLQQEIEAQVIQVKDGKLEDWLSLISEDGITKVYLHYCYEDYTPGLRAEIHSELAKNPNLRIICQYENIPKSDIEKKAKFKAIKHTEIASDSLTPKELGGHETPTEEFIKTLEKTQQDKIRFSQYSVGGNDSLRSQKVERTEDPFIKKSEEYKSKRRRKK